MNSDINSLMALRFRTQDLVASGALTEGGAARRSMVEDGFPDGVVDDLCRDSYVSPPSTVKNPVYVDASDILERMIREKEMKPKKHQPNHFIKKHVFRATGLLNSSAWDEALKQRQGGSSADFTLDPSDKSLSEGLKAESTYFYDQLQECRTQLKENKKKERQARLMAWRRSDSEWDSEMLEYPSLSGKTYDDLPEVHQRWAPPLVEQYSRISHRANEHLINEALKQIAIENAPPSFRAIEAMKKAEKKTREERRAKEARFNLLKKAIQLIRPNGLA